MKNLNNVKNAGYMMAGLGGIIATVIIGFIVVWMFFMRTETVEPGHELVIVDKPYFVGNEGVRDETLKEGRILLWRTSDVVPIRMTPQSLQVKFDDLVSKDSYLLDFETTIQYQIIDSKRIVKDFGATDWFTNNMQRQYMEYVRAAVKVETMADMMSNIATADRVDVEVTGKVEKLVKDANLPIRVLGVSLGRAKPNDNVLAQINQTAQELQRHKTLAAATDAELQRAKEQTAKAAADNAYRNALGMDTRQFIELEAIKAYSAACARSERCIVTPGMGTNVIIPANR